MLSSSSNGICVSMFIFECTCTSATEASVRHPMDMNI